MRNQILHIFKKDCRYLWREIALSFAVMIAYGWQEATRRPGAHPLEVGFFLLSQMLPTLVPLSWAFLLLRVVQAESLVGDRQFWVTRPYDWKKLLAAKLLFVLVFFHLPLFILQSFLLLMAGYVPMSYIPGLLGLQLMWVLFLVLPVTTLAAVTASLGQFVLAVLGVLLFVISVIPALFSLVPAAGVSGGNSIPSTLCATVLLAISIVVLLW